MQMSITVAEDTTNDNKGNFAKATAGTAIGAALALALGGFWYQHTQVTDVRAELAKTHQSMESMRGQMETSVAATKREADESIAKLNEKIAADAAAAKKSAQVLVVRTQANTSKQTDKVLEAVNAKNAELLAQIEQLKQENESKVSSVNEALTGVKTDVGAVRTEVASTRNELDQAVLELKRVTGDMGIMSGLIATNATELEALKKLGDRDYFEFTLNKNGNAVQKLGGIQLALKKADVKRSRFTMDVLADDRKVEKKDKTVNEPVQFYTSQARTPLELVVNKIGKDTVSGYLAVPKLKQIAHR
jgi:hypothetical protein